jgi:magnesium transporter
VAAKWHDLVDPTYEDLAGSLQVALDPAAVEALVAPPGDGRVRPLIESHGTYVLGILAVARPDAHENRVDYLEVGFVATRDGVVTVRKSAPGGAVPEVSVLESAVTDETTAGELVHALVDDVADGYLGLLDALYGEIDELEDHIDALSGPNVRRRLVELRHELLHARTTISATRAAVRRIVDRRCELSTGELFPAEVELAFADTYETLVRATEEVDVARDLLGGVRDYHQSKVSESQNDVVKKLTVIASLVLVPSLIVGFYGQNFESAFDDDAWSLGVSLSLIAGSTAAQLALYRWRRWI